MTTKRRRSKRKGVLDWWQNVLDETKDLVDDTIDRVRDDDGDDDLADDIDELKQAVAELNAKLDRLASDGGGK
jgi:NAD(P)H-dependent FMN reductase